jgi:4-alpha-glucanotransferase
MTALHGLATAAGIDPTYLSAGGTSVTSSDESLVATLRALAPELGIGFSCLADAPAALAALVAARWAQLVPPVVVGWDGVLVVPFAVPAELDAAWEIEVVTEAGRSVRAGGRLFELPAGDHAWPGGAVHCVRRVRISLDGELGYHAVRWQVAGRHGEAFAIVAPERAWAGPGEGPRRWGVFAPVYALASAASGQAGDLATLRRLFEQVERRGGSYVAILPILAASLDEPCQFSPYSPASRMFWNELYLDLATLAGELGGAAPVAPAFAQATLIDYRAQYQWRRAALDPIAERAYATHATEIDAWATRSAVYDYAAFRAFGEATRRGWQSWPAAWRDGVPVVTSRAQAVALGADPARVTTHAVAQWAMQRQVAQLGRGRVSLYLDLPVGVNSDAYEVWRHRGLFLTTLSAGAPPDPLFEGGQDWGLPPLSPVGLRRDRYRYFIHCLRHHMQVSGMLRIDHVMGLFRLYCVPAGRPATDGVYVRYPHEELLAVLTVESRRARCALVGEDLGTVPDQVRPAMARHGLFRLHVGQWVLPTALGEPPTPSPAEAVASLNTHDTPTFAGWWRGSDLDDARELGQLTEAQAGTARAARAEAREATLAYVRRNLSDDAVRTGAPSHDALSELELAMVGATQDLVAGPAEVVLVTLDDLALDPVPHNVPGTTSERPNWQRRIAGWADALDEDRAAAAAAAAVAAVVAARPPAR